MISLVGDMMMGENLDLVEVKMEQAEEEGTLPVPPSPPRPSPSPSSRKSMQVIQLTDKLKQVTESNENFEQKLEETKAILVRALNHKSGKIINLKNQLTLESNKYAELENFAYQSSRMLVEMLGDMKTCLDVAVVAAHRQHGKEKEAEDIMAQLPVILNSLKEDLGKMEEKDRQGITKELGVLWGVIRRIRLKLTAGSPGPVQFNGRQVEGSLDQYEIDEDLNGGDATAEVLSMIGPPPPPVDMEDEDEVVFIEAVQKTKALQDAPRPIAHSDECIKRRILLASSSSSKDTVGLQPSSLDQSIEVTTQNTATPGQGQSSLEGQELELPSAAAITGAGAVAEQVPLIFEMLEETPPPPETELEEQQSSGKGKKREEEDDDLRRSKRLKRGRPLGSTKAKAAKKGKMVKKAKCPICGKRLKDRASVKGHQRRMHGIGGSGKKYGAAKKMPMSPVMAPDVGQAIAGTSSAQVQVHEAASEMAVVHNHNSEEVPDETNPCQACELGILFTDEVEAELSVEISLIKIEKSEVGLD